jgi:hypothetical protein
MNEGCVCCHAAQTQGIGVKNVNEFNFSQNLEILLKN